jgi:hypothetical protein
MKTPNTTRFLSGILKTSLLALAASSLLASSAQAQQGPIKTVWYILLENRNWSENETSGGAQILGSSAAPYLNSLITPNTTASTQVSYCSAYHNVLATASGSNPSIHPSEPNYIWMECGSNNSINNDNDPYGSGVSVQTVFNYAQANASTGTVSMQNLSGLLQNASIGWSSYTEGTQQLNSVGNNYNQNGGTLTNNLPALALWTVPLVSFSGSSSVYTNPYNGTHQYNFATKHTGQLFFPTTNGCTVNTADSGTTNVEASHYPPLPQLASDLANGTCAPYTVITPDQYNDMHTALASNFTYQGVTYPANGDLEKIAQGDNFCSIVVPQIMASQQYKNGGAIVIWTDETEGSNQNDFNHTLAEIVISPYAKGNAYQSTLNYTHSSDLATMQEIFGVTANTPTGYLADAANYSQPTPAGQTGTSQTGFSWSSESTGGGFGSGGPLNNGSTRDLSDLFVSGTIPALPALNYTASGYTTNRHNPGVYVQTITVTNNSGSAVTNPVYLVVSNLSSNTVLSNSAGTTVNNYAGSPYVLVSSTGLAAGASASVTLQFHVFLGGGIADTLDPIQTSAQP